MYLITLISYFFVLGMLFNRQGYLLLFFYIVYTLQFWPLFFPGEESVFWLNKDYTFSKDSIISLYMLKILAVTVIAFYLAALGCAKKNTHAEGLIFKESIPNGINLILIMMIPPLLLIKYISNSELINGMDLLITSLIVISFFFALSKKHKSQIILISILYFLYVLVQVSSEDRNFLGVPISGLIFYLTFYRINLKSFIITLVLVMFILILGVYISITRNGVDVSFYSFFSYLYYNSWVAVIRPVIDMLIAEDYIEKYYYGKTYIDLILSMAPSPLYSLLEIEKPYTADNPAMWYHFQGGGGMHFIGVALKNFGLVGVFLQAYICSFLLIKLENKTKLKQSVYYYSFFVCVSLVLMKSIWYSMLDLMNMITFFMIVIVFIKSMMYILPLQYINYKKR